MFERDGTWYIAYCPGIPGANGQGETKEEAREAWPKRVRSFSKTAAKRGFVEYRRKPNAKRLF